MNCTNPKTIILQQTKSVKYQRRIRVGCGQCINCKNKRAAEITNKLVDESTQHKDVCIVVLTYDESKIIYGEETKHGRYGTLWHAHVQKFIKLLRYYIKEGTKKGELSRGETKLKYYVAGEYGDDKNRPHYHVALFGLNDLRPEHRNLIAKCWQRGLILYYDKPRELTRKGYSYVGQYINKKIYDGKHLSYYTDRGVNPPYNIGSKGLGKAVALKNRKKFEENDYKYADNENHIVRIPRYYIKKYKEQDLEEYLKLYNSIRDKKITPEEGQKILKELWHKSTEYKLARLTKKLQAERKKMMAQEGIITDYTRLDETTLKQTELWQKIKRDIRREKKEVTKKLEKKPWDRIEKRKLKNILRIHEKGLDRHIKNQVYYYQVVHGETYEMHLADLDRAQKLEAQRLKWILENPRNKDYQ